MSSTRGNKVEEAALAWSMFSESDRAAARWVLLEAAAAIADMPRSRGWTVDEALLHAQKTIVGLERDRLRTAAEPEEKDWDPFGPEDQIPEDIRRDTVTERGWKR